MDITKFITEHWLLIKNEPSVFFILALLFFGIGFRIGKLFYGNLAEINKARLEAARDDLARLEKKAADERNDASFLRAEVAALRADIERMPKVIVGEGTPNNNTGRDGDIYFQINKTPTPRRMPSAEMFLRKPETNLKSALSSAKSISKPIFAVIYDPDHPTQSKLSYSLGYFLEYQTTRKLVDEHFICALVPSSDVDAKLFIPDDDPLENCRLVVLSPNGTVIRSEGVYANPDEGLKRTREAIAKSESIA